jgi:hypothetical protein
MLASLLISNVAGLVHIGCTSSSPCSITHQAEIPACTCGRKHSDSAQQAKQGSQPTEEHDADDCSICKNFFAIRNAIACLAVVINWKPVPTQQLNSAADRNPTVADYSGGPSVRGPPQG